MLPESDKESWPGSFPVPYYTRKQASTPRASAADDEIKANVSGHFFDIRFFKRCDKQPAIEARIRWGISAVPCRTSKM
jgi:hypothetical protein